MSAISSDFAVNYASGSPFVGVYTLRGLTPNASYAVYVDEILDGGFSTPPRFLAGPEEFFNGPTESNDSLTDPPGNVFTPVVALAGVTTPDIDIIFNRLLPGPIPAGDDTSIELFLDFSFELCGQRYESVFINSNGSLSFGDGSIDFSETIAEMLTGPPRIAGLWDDLDASCRAGVDDLLRDVPLAHGVGSRTCRSSSLHRREHVRDHALRRQARRPRRLGR